MIEKSQLDLYFTEDQQRDVVDLYRTCESSIPARTRRPRVRKVKPGHIPRPVNSFMTFRAEKQSLIRKFCPFANHRDISKIVANWWRKIDPDEKEQYFTKAAAAKVEHAKKYPDYVFKPKSKKQKKLLAAKKEVGFKETPLARVSELDVLGTVDPQATIKEEECEINYRLSYPYSYDSYGDENNFGFGLYGWHANDCQDFHNNPTDLEKYNDMQSTGGHYFSSITPTTQSLETPLLDYSQSPLLPEESYRGYNEFYTYNGSENLMIIPALDDNTTLYALSLNNFRY